VGGDSIKAIQISARLLQQQLKMEIKDLFANPTIRQLEKFIISTEGTAITTPQGAIKGDVALTPIQHWFFENFPPSCRHHFNQAVMLYRAEGFDKKIILSVLTALAGHHDGLRMVYESADAFRQTNRGAEAPLFDLEVLPVQESEIEKEASRIQASFDLQKGPLIKVGLFKTDKGDHLLLVIHHLVVDGVSWRILLEDLAAGYKDAARGKKIKFPAKTTSFREWAQKLTAYAQSPALQEQVPYWKGVERMEIPPLPVDETIQTPDSKESTETGSREAIRITLEKENTSALLTGVNGAYNTEINDILLTALALSMKRWGDLDRIALNLEGHGREAIIPDANITRTVGWFTAAFPVVLDISACEDTRSAIKHIKETLRRIPEKGTGYGILRYLAGTEKKQGLMFDTSPRISFNYLGQFAEPEGEESGGGIGFSHIGAGPMICPEMEDLYSLDINGMVTAGELSLTFAYTGDEFGTERIDALAEIFRGVLVEIISHCMEKETAESTPSDLEFPDLTIAELEGLQRRFTEENREIANIYPLSPMQESMLFHARMNESSSAYFEQMTMKLTGSLDVSLLERTLARLVEIHELLRTVFVYDRKGRPCQVVRGAQSGDAITLVQPSASPRGVGQADIDRYKREDMASGFDLSRWPLMRVGVLQSAEEAFTIVWSFHHILMDGWCFGILFKDFIDIYQALQKGEKFHKEPVSYSRFISWLEEQDRAKGLAYWQHYLKGFEKPTPLPSRDGADGPFDKTIATESAASPPDYRQAKTELILEEELTASLSKTASRHRVTLNTLCQALWGILLQKYNDTSDALFGAVVSGRPPEIPGVEQIVGLFINTVPVRIKCPAHDSFSLLLKNVQRHAVAAKSYEYLPLSEIQALSPLKNKLADHIFVFENYPLEDTVREGGKKNDIGFGIEDADMFEQTGYDLDVMVAPGGDRLVIRFTYNASLYETDFMQATADRLKHIMRQVTRDTDTAIKDISIITDREKYKLLNDFNDSETILYRNIPVKPLHQLLEDQVERSPESTALVFQTQRISYRQLNEKSNAAASLLIKDGITPGSIVALSAQPSTEALIAIWGILKAGAAYLPIDPGHPEERKSYILKDSCASALVAVPPAVPCRPRH
ncbi:MAG: AMP-binding protein, partial [bacterium]|nr:AMP-binding protein [bacterium]